MMMRHAPRTGSRGTTARWWRRTACVVPWLAALSACAVGPDYVRPALDVPATYVEDSAWAAAAPADAQLRGDWWTLFGDPALDDLEGQVDVSNQTLVAAKARFAQARAQAGVAQAAASPQIGAGAAADRFHTSANVVGRSLAGKTVDDFSLPLSASWEIDLWGRIGKSVEAARADAQASAADVESARLALHAELALDYFQLRSLDAEYGLLQRTLAGYRRALDMTIERHRVGIASAVDLAQAQAQLDATQAQATDLGDSRARFQHAIATLTGRPAEQFQLPARSAGSDDVLAQVGVVPAIPPELPSRLLERRPDVAAAERRVAAANARIGVARAAFFPSLSLGGTAGLESSALSQLLVAPSSFWALGPMLVAPLLDGGARRSRSLQANAAFDAATADYRERALVAFQEVEDNLASLRILGEEAQEQARSIASSEHVLALANQRYRIGAAGYLDVVVAQSAALASERQGVDVARRRMLASVQLIKALGGGWQQGCEPKPSTTIAPGKCS
jgi:NodT family efflux transporter outer membrane factor (OMF) lipoprotein